MEVHQPRGELRRWEDDRGEHQREEDDQIRDQVRQQRIAYAMADRRADQVATSAVSATAGISSGERWIVTS